MRKARRGRMSWAAKVAAPWGLAIGVLASFIADAGQEVPTGASRAPQSSLAAANDADNVKAVTLFSRPATVYPRVRQPQTPASRWPAAGPDRRHTPGPDPKRHRGPQWGRAFRRLVYWPDATTQVACVIGNR